MNFFDLAGVAAASHTFPVLGRVADVMSVRRLDLIVVATETRANHNHGKSVTRMDSKSQLFSCRFKKSSA